jgi:hypothetical protein
MRAAISSINQNRLDPGPSIWDRQARSDTRVKGCYVQTETLPSRDCRTPFSGTTNYEQDKKGLADFDRVWCGNRRCRTVAICDGVAEFLISRDPLAYVISSNLKRRLLAESQRGMIATRIETMKQGRPGKDASLHDISRERGAELMTLASGRSVEHRRLKKKAFPSSAPPRLKTAPRKNYSLR